MRTIGLFNVLFILTAEGRAQVLQQPAIRTFGGSTTVSVPDRGSVTLGGISSAASGRKVYGPGYRGSSIGLERSASSVSVGVTIIDLHAMDEAILAQGQADQQVDPWMMHLRERAISSNSVNSPVPSAAIDRSAQAERFIALAVAAEGRGKRSLAKLHWQMAAKYGSERAVKTLQNWSIAADSTRRAD